MTGRRSDARQAREEVIDQLRLEGIQAAYSRAIALLRDENTPPTAAATLVRVVFAAGGLLNVSDDDKPQRELHEMTNDELDRMLEETRRLLAKPDILD